MLYLLELVAELCDLLGLGYQGRRRRAAGLPFGFYPGTGRLLPNA